MTTYRRRLSASSQGLTLRLAMFTCVLLFATSLVAGQTDFGNDVCAKDAAESIYCKCVGKTAYHKGPTMELPVGKVVGVVWKKKGSCRSKNCQIVAARDGYYLVVKDDMGQLTKDPHETECR